MQWRKKKSNHDNAIKRNYDDATTSKYDVVKTSVYDRAATIWIRCKQKTRHDSRICH